LTLLPEVLLVDATGSDHPRRAGLATYLGAILEPPAVGVTHRPLTGQDPEIWPVALAQAPPARNYPGE
jgi:deoxyribonuclease V